MNANLDLKSLRSQLEHFFKKAMVHTTFIAILAILFAYLLVVWRISALATAEPAEDAQATVGKSIPKVDKKAIEQITQLEANNSEVRALFNEARNNPFQE